MYSPNGSEYDPGSVRLGAPGRPGANREQADLTANTAE